MPDEWDIRVPGSQITHGVEAVERLLRVSERPSAIFVTSDRVALGVVCRLLEQGIRVPEDVAVIGYDDIPYAACARVPLTTVAIPVYLLGEISARILLSRLEGAARDQPSRVLLSPGLVLRASCP